MKRLHRMPLAAALVLGAALLAPAAARARSSYYGSTCATCHDATPTTCNGCHAHRGTVSGSLPKTTFSPGESFAVTIKAGERTGWWRAAVLDGQNKVVATASATGAGSTRVTVKAPTTAGSYTWKAAWYGDRYTDTPSATSWVADARNSGHGYRTVALSTFTVAAASAPSASLSPAALDLGTVTTGTSASKTATVTNSGDADLVVKAPAACDSSTSAFVTISPSAGFTVAAGEAVTLTVTFAPSSTGTARGCWNLGTNDSAHPTLQLTATGTGQPPGSSSSGGASSSGASSSGASSSGGSSGGSSSSGASSGGSSSSSGSSSSGGGGQADEQTHPGGCATAGGALSFPSLLALALASLRRRRASGRPASPTRTRSGRTLAAGQGERRGLPGPRGHRQLAPARPVLPERRGHLLRP